MQLQPAYVPCATAYRQLPDRLLRVGHSHIERRHLKIRELVQRAIIDTKWIATDDNVADIFTKYVGRDKFKKFRNDLLNM